MGKILIIDDDEMICLTLSRIFNDMGHDVAYVMTLAEGKKKAITSDFDVVFLDVRLPDGNGLEAIPIIQATPVGPEVIIITGFADSDGAELAIKNNAWDYIRKPASIERISLTLKRALQYREEKLAVKTMITLKRDNIIGNSRKIMTCLDLVGRAARSNANILVSGETGTGKELFARAIHANSDREDQNFVVVDCGSLPETLVESLLFGHTKGAFTGASRAEDGLIRHAHHGTLFLDEVGELSLNIQKSFLRVLQERKFRPVGGTKEIESDFRLVAATNRNLDDMVASGQFRSDLQFRLSSITIKLPPLRERTEDIKELALHYIKMLCDSYKVAMKGFSAEFFDVLNAYHWPGNVRELFSTLEWAVAQAPHESTLFSKHLPSHIRIQVMRSAFDEETQPQPDETDNDDFPTNIPKWQIYRKALIAQGEERYLQNLLAQTNGKIKEAAKISGLSQPRLYELLRKYQVRA
jgi:two-component system NtrC family response regulator